MFLPELKAKRGIEKTTTSKGLMHSNDHIKENWTTVEGRRAPYPPSFGGITVTYSMRVCISQRHIMKRWVLTGGGGGGGGWGGVER